jgi:RNA polymerase sigma factor (sigma-70 family)
VKGKITAGPEEAGWLEDMEAFMIQDDMMLIGQVLQGDDTAYARLVDQYKDRLFHYLLGMIGERQDAEDLAQEVFIKAYFHLGTYSGSSTFWTWLYRIAYNHCIDEFRRRKRKPFSYPITGLERADAAKSPEQALLRKERQELLQEHVLELPEDYRAVFILRHTRQLSCREIGDLLDIEEETVRIRLYRARKKLQASILGSRKGGTLNELLNL